jgi:4-phosphopantoate--beta-alanine ligase
MSRTAVLSNITVVDNVIRSLPLMVEYAREMKDWPDEKLREIVAAFDNDANLSQALKLMIEHLSDQTRIGSVEEDEQ